jgi:hypothetical protein
VTAARAAAVRILEGGKMPTELRDCAEDPKILERASDLHAAAKSRKKI